MRRGPTSTIRVGPGRQGRLSFLPAKERHDEPSDRPDHRTSRRGVERGDRVFLWRCEELRRAGYGAEAASLLAAIPDIDLDLVIELRARRLRAA